MAQGLQNALDTHLNDPADCSVLDRKSQGQGNFRAETKQ